MPTGAAIRWAKLQAGNAEAPVPVPIDTTALLRMAAGELLGKDFEVFLGQTEPALVEQYVKMGMDELPAGIPSNCFVTRRGAGECLPSW